MLINHAIVQTYLLLPTCYDSNCQIFIYKILIFNDLIIIKKNKILNA